MHVNVTVTGARYQPPLSGGRSTAAVMDGAVVSTDTVAVAEAVLPATSVAVPVTA